MNSWLEYSKHFQEFDAHYLVRPFFFRKKLLGFIAIHQKGESIPSFGATRVLPYHTTNDALKDALLLSKTMSEKLRLAGFPYGGAKAVIIDDQIWKTHREQVLKEYANAINLLEGTFITGADMGLLQEDIVFLNRFTQYVVGIRVDPAWYTALGLIEAMKACARFLFGSANLSGQSFAIQGLGKIGRNVLKLLYETASGIVVSEKSEKILLKMKTLYPNIAIVQEHEVYRSPTTFFCPCGEGGTITVQTAKLLNCKAIVGGANNQLESDKASSVLCKRKIIYCPDILVNSGGLISVVLEYELKDRVNNNLITERIAHMSNILSETLKNQPLP